jgi:uncharacterized protein (DUF58 family)
MNFLSICANIFLILLGVWLLILCLFIFLFLIMMLARFMYSITKITVFDDISDFLLDIIDL